MNFKLGDKRRVVSKKITKAEVSRNAIFLTLFVTNIEHDYAYALELKKAESPRARHHMRNKLRKAAKRAQEFLGLLDELGEGKVLTFSFLLFNCTTYFVQKNNL